MKANITQNILDLKTALKKNGVKVNLDSYPVLCIDRKNHFCTFLETNILEDGNPLTFVFHPQTGRLMENCLKCPIVK